MDNLEASWRRFSLQEKSEQTVIVDNSFCKFCLIGSLWSSPAPSFNNQVLFTTMRSIWRPVKQLDTDVIDDNKFLFTFHGRGDIGQVIEGRPWMFDKHILLLQQVSGMEEPNQIPLYTSPFWLRLYDLPIGAMRLDLIMKLARQAGKAVKVGERANRDAEGCYARVQIEVDVRKPLVPGVLFEVKGVDEPIWIRFKYECLPDFCFRCGMLGHTDRDCDSIEEKSNQYGEFLHANTNATYSDHKVVNVPITTSARHKKWKRRKKRVGVTLSSQHRDGGGRSEKRKDTMAIEGVDHKRQYTGQRGCRDQ